MTPREFVQPSQSNLLKGSVHGVMLLGALVCCAYNVAAFWYRRERHNAVNGLLYAGLSYVELEHVRHHVQ